MGKGGDGAEGRRCRESGEASGWMPELVSDASWEKLPLSSGSPPPLCPGGPGRFSFLSASPEADGEGGAALQVPAWGAPASSRQGGGLGGLGCPEERTSLQPGPLVPLALPRLDGRPVVLKATVLGLNVTVTSQRS